MLFSFCGATKSHKNDYWGAKGIIVNIDISVSFMRLFDCTEREFKDGCYEVYMYFAWIPVKGDNKRENLTVSLAKSPHSKE